ncbi:MAG TPA: TetR/AcrR family transcriptional regulator [Ktedonobacteraceae bacterium]|nr:TetR/AcrR family transcriptional regulator [Ktedonobacteraceae bacterium]
MLRNSSPNTEDPRVKRTQKCLWEALRTLLEERCFEQISVTDICEEATINRTTFYKHFESKYELLAYGLKYDLATAQRKRRRVRSAEEREQWVAQFLEEMTSDRHYYRRLLVDKEDQWLSTLLRRQMAENIEVRLANAQAHGRRFTIPLPVIAQFYAGARVALITWWLENEGAVSPEELAHAWRSLCQGEVPLPDVEQEFLS